MGGLANYCFHISRSQGMSDLRARGDSYDTKLILIGVVISSWTFVVTRGLTWMPWYGVL